MPGPSSSQGPRRSRLGQVSDHLHGGRLDRVLPSRLPEFLGKRFTAIGEVDPARTVDNRPESVGVERGGDIGPDLSRIGQIRSWRDLLESTLYPSSTIVNSYETYTIVTRKGTPHTGIIHHETADTVTLRNARLEEIAIPRAGIVRMEATPLSLMPQGLDKNIGDDDFPHIIAFLKSLR